MKIQIALVLTILAVTGCSTTMYDGPTRPQSELATIAGNSMHILSIDGKDVPGFFRLNASPIEILPGERTIKATLSVSGPLGSTTSKFEPLLRFLAVAGRNYVVRPKFVNAKQWYPEVVDSRTGEVVARPGR